MRSFGTRDRGCSRHPAFPAPSFRRGPTDLQNLGRNRAARMRDHVWSSLRAKRSNPSLDSSRHGLLRRFAPRNDALIHVRDPAAHFRPSFAISLSLSRREGAGNAGCTLHPRSRVQTAQTKAHTSIQVSGNTPTSPAQWLYGLLRALPGGAGLLSPSSAGYFPPT